MERYIFAFHGGSMPESPEEGAAIMKKWEIWMESIGAGLADPGSILGASSTVSDSGVSDDGGPDPLSGYMVVLAKDKQAAIEIAKGCPILQNAGRVEVAQLMDM